MRKILLLFCFSLFSVFLKAQGYYTPYVYCVDSTRINIYYQCEGDYNPVCGCDGKTYRNSCAADNWGGLLTSHNYMDGVCGNFDVDLVPNPIVPGSPTNGHGSLSIYTNVGPVAVLIQIIDVFGRQWYLQQIIIPISPPAYTTDIQMDGFQQGIYYMFVTINGETHYKKIMKANLE